MQNVIKKTNFVLQTKYQFGVHMVLRTEKEVQKRIYCRTLPVLQLIPFFADNPKSKWCKDSTKNTHLVAK